MADEPIDMRPGGIVHLGENDQDKAARHRALVEIRLRELCALMDAAKHDGMTVNFTIGQDAFSRNVVQTLAITKVLA